MLMEQKDLYPATYKLIKSFSADGCRSITNLNPPDTFSAVGTFLNEIFFKYPSDKFLDVLQNEHISTLLHYFFTKQEMQENFKVNLFVLVSQEFEMLFNELFDEAHDENMHELADDFPNILAETRLEELRAIQ